MSKRIITQQGTVNPMSDSAPVNALKCQFITDMELAGMARPSRKRYLFAVERLAGSMILAAIMSGRPITKRENEDQAICGKKLKCPYCGGDQLILLEQLPRPRSRSP